MMERTCRLTRNGLHFAASLYTFINKYHYIINQYFFQNNRKLDNAASGKITLYRIRIFCGKVQKIS